MGTNYYLYEDVCECCGRGSESLHIGKSSAGWCFGLHVIPEENLMSLSDWEKRWRGGVIKNEYDEVITPEKMKATITEREGRPWEEERWHFYKDEADFHDKNGSERGPNNMLRHRLGGLCVGHGEGTWDCLDGDFS